MPAVPVPVINLTVQPAPVRIVAQQPSAPPPPPPPPPSYDEAAAAAIAPPPVVVLQDFAWYDDVPDFVKSCIASDYVCSWFANFLGRGWQATLLELGIGEVDIDRELTNWPRSLHMVLFHLLALWRKRHKRVELATVDALVQAIVKTSVVVDVRGLQHFLRVTLPDRIKQGYIEAIA